MVAHVESAGNGCFRWSGVVVLWCYDVSCFVKRKFRRVCLFWKDNGLVLICTCAADRVFRYRSEVISRHHDVFTFGSVWKLRTCAWCLCNNSVVVCIKLYRNMTLNGTRQVVQFATCSWKKVGSLLSLLHVVEWGAYEVLCARVHCISVGMFSLLCVLLRFYGYF